MRWSTTANAVLRKLEALLKLPGTTQFNLEDAKRQELKGSSTSAILSKKEHFGPDWFTFPLDQQDAIVMRLLTEESEARIDSLATRRTRLR
jgi:CRISPR-associated endonuclease Csn1